MKTLGETIGKCQRQKSHYLPYPIQKLYKKIGIDENTSYQATVNKGKVAQEYSTRLRKIWESELSSYNKSISHNAFAVLVLNPTFEILD